MELGAKLLQKYAAHFPLPDPTVVLAEHKTVSGVRIKTYTPVNATAEMPAVCYFHGGGFVVGEVDRDDPLVTRLAKDTGLVFASVEYRLAPKHVYPAGFNDCTDAANWCIDNAKFLGTNGSVLLMGGSAGAALALGAALKLIEEGKAAMLQGVVACQPMTLHPDAVPAEYQDHYTSYDEHATHTLNSAQAMRAFFGESLSESSGPNIDVDRWSTELHNAPKVDPYIQCLHHPRLKDLPAVYINACECDTLRDDARALKRTLDKLGYRTWSHAPQDDPNANV